MTKYEIETDIKRRKFQKKIKLIDLVLENKALFLVSGPCRLLLSMNHFETIPFPHLLTFYVTLNYSYINCQNLTITLTSLPQGTDLTPFLLSYHFFFIITKLYKQCHRLQMSGLSRVMKSSKSISWPYFCHNIAVCLHSWF